MRRRALLCGLLGWVVPGIVAVPLMGTKESSRGRGGAWHPLRLVGARRDRLRDRRSGGGVLGRGSGNLTEAFRSGLAGVCVAWIAAIAVEMLVTASVSVLHMGGLSILMPIPFVLGYAAGFGLAALLSRPVGPG